MPNKKPIKKVVQKAIADETYLPKPKILPRKPGVDSGFRAPYEPEQYVNYPFKHYETLPEVVIHSKTKNKYKTLPNITIDSKKKSPIKQAVESTGIQMYNPDTKRMKSTANPGQTKSQIKQSTSNIKGNSLKDSVKELTAMTQFAPMPLISIPSQIINSGIGMSDMIEARKRGDVLNENINSAGAMPWQYMIPGPIGTGLEAASAAADLTDNFGLEEKKNGGWLDNYGEEANANEGRSSAPKEWIGEGYSTQGRNYSPAWGGQFAEGGSLTNSGPGDGKFPFPMYSQPTRSDSLFLLNNNKIIKKLLDSGRYEWLKDKKENTDIKKINPKDWKQRFNEKKYFFDNDIPREMKLGFKKKGKLSDYRQQKDKFIGTSDWAGGGGDDYGFPMQYIHPDIAPQYEGDLFPISGDMENSPFVYSFGYDELAITPWDMLTPQQQKDRLKKYGVSGTPYTEPEELSLKKKVTKMEPKSSSSKPITPQLRTIEQPNIELPDVQRGKYRTSYYDPQMKDWNERAFMTQQESDQFADEMSKRGYPGSYGNVTQRTQFQTGGTLPPIYTFDPELVENFRDSTVAHNKTLEIINPKYYQGEGDYGNVPSWYNFKGGRYKADKFARKNNIDVDYNYYRTGKFPGKIQPIDTGDWGEGMAYPIYKKPIQPYILKKLNKQVTHIDPISASRMTTPGLRPMQQPGVQMSGAVPQGNWNVEYLDPTSKKTETKHFITNEDAEQFYNDPANKASRKYSNASSVGRMQLGGNVYPVNYVPQAQRGMRCPSNVAGCGNIGQGTGVGRFLTNVGEGVEDVASSIGRGIEQLFHRKPKMGKGKKNRDTTHTGPYDRTDSNYGTRESFVPSGPEYIFGGLQQDFVPDYRMGRDFLSTPTQSETPMYDDAIVSRYRSPETNYIGTDLGAVNAMRNTAAMGASIPGSVGFTYARTNSPAPSNGPYAKKTLPSAQNGQEMSFYQHGLDWKPKTISKNGGWLDKYIPEAQTGFNIPGVTDFKMPLNRTDAPGLSIQEKQKQDEAALEIQRRNDATAKQQFIGTPHFQTLDEQKANKQKKKQFVQTHPNTELNDQDEIVSKNSDRDFEGKPITPNAKRWDKGLEHIMNVLEATSALTGSGQIGSNLLRLGATALEKKIGRNIVSKSLKNLTSKINPTLNAIDEAGAYVQLDPIGIMGNRLNSKLYNPTTALNTANNTITGVDKNLKNSALEASDLILGDNNLRNLTMSSAERPSVNTMLRDQLSLAKPKESGLDFMQRWYNHPATRDRYNMFRNPSPAKEAGEYKNWADNYTQAQKLSHGQWSLDAYTPKTYRDLWKDKDWKQALKLHSMSSGVSYGEPTGIYTNKGVLGRLGFGKIAEESTKAHELTHLIEANGALFNDVENNALLSPFNRTYAEFQAAGGPKYPSIFKRRNPQYYTNPTEIHARMNEARFNLGLSPDDVFTQNHYDEIAKKYNWFGMGKYIKDPKRMIQLMNNFYTPAGGVIGAGVVGSGIMNSSNEQPAQQKKGGVIKDDRGQWAHPGEITEIGSNRITMQGVPYPVLGISDLGDQQMMYPGEEYKFKGNKVTEFPITQKGNKKENGGWLSQYK